jgi:hypothetical protein
MSVLLVVRRIVDWVVIVAMTLLITFRLGMLGNAYGPPWVSPFEKWKEVTWCLLWIFVPLYIIRLAFKTRLWAGYFCFLGVPLAAYIPSSIFVRGYGGRVHSAGIVLVVDLSVRIPADPRPFCAAI